ncbi:eukaryotic translation initiation factor 5B-like protein [Tanacetum coccineum]
MNRPLDTGALVVGYVVMAVKYVANGGIIGAVLTANFTWKDPTGRIISFAIPKKVEALEALSSKTDTQSYAKNMGHFMVNVLEASALKKKRNRNKKEKKDATATASASPVAKTIEKKKREEEDKLKKEEDERFREGHHRRPKVVVVDEWDAMSWDDIDLQLPSITVFADEGKATEPKPITKGKTKESQSIKKSQQYVVDKGKTKVEIEQSDTTLRSRICYVMGHVDAGKTKLLDFIKRTNVQKTKAGGITQQISATYIPTENIRERTKDLKAGAKIDVAGLLVIDTPGHESFNNLRSRGSSLCDVAILVVDITNGLQPQTIESIKLY